MALMISDLALTTDEAMEYLRVSKPTILKLIHQGDINAVWVGKGYRILQSELSRFLAGEETYAEIQTGDRVYVRKEGADVAEGI